MCAARNLRLHKFASNSNEVLEALPADDRAKDLKDLDLRHDALPVQRSLGSFWCIESDTLGFRIELNDKPLTRRGILSTTSSVYDPLGVVAPVILVSKQILQDLCRQNIDWDEHCTTMGKVESRATTPRESKDSPLCKAPRFWNPSENRNSQLLGRK
ncbi:hypothetical protein QZH41_005902 [Actinostola sp. cb2023]|nr:hypothetical protein QZH41_005902 [Actinostola sp. cb2023]